MNETLITNFVKAYAPGKNLFDRAVEKFGSLKHNEAFFFVPALVLGGSEDIKYVKKGDAGTHQHVLIEMGK